MDQRKVIVTVAPTGGMAHKTQNHHLPTRPAEIANDVVACYNEGASIAALHARRSDDGATCDPDTYREINDLIRSRCNIVINNSTGGGVHGDMVRLTDNGYWEIDWYERLKGLEAGGEMCTLDAATMVASFGGREILMHTPPSRCHALAEKMHAAGIKPEWEVFSPTHLVQDVTSLIKIGYDAPPHFINLILGAHRGFQNAMPYSPRTLQYMVDHLPSDSLFCVSGVGAAQLPAAMNSLLLGGHVRVGLEDNLYYQAGDLATNVMLVQRVVRLIIDLGLEVATPEETRRMLGLQPACHEAIPN